MARLWREGQPTAIAAREGFSTREGAVEWATRYEGETTTIVAPIVVVAGIGVVVLLAVASAFANLARALSGEVRVTTRLGRGREVERDVEFVPPREGARARPITTRSRGT